MKIKEYTAEIIDITLSLSDLEEMCENTPYQGYCAETGRELRIWVTKNKEDAE